MTPSNPSALGPSNGARRVWASLAAIAFAFASPLAAQTLGARVVEQMESLAEWKRGWTPTERRIDSNLLAATRMMRGLPITSVVPRLPGVWDAVRLDAMGTVEVDITADVTDGLLASLRALEGQVLSSHPQYRTLRARLPLLRLHAAADLPGVQFIERAAQLTTNSGPNNSQGDAAHRAPVIRAQGITGAGIKIGVLSDGVKSLGARQATGDLPPGVTVLAAGPADADEGTAMLEIVHDLAPQAQLFYATAFNSPADFANNIIALRNAGCQVIVDDITYFNEGVFQDGIVAQAVKTVTDQGVLFFSSAANSGNKNDGTSGTWEGDFVNSGGTFRGGLLHLFATGINANQITGNTGPISLKWSDPLGASSNDYDLYVLDSNLANVVGFSENLQDGNDDPFEITDSGFAPGNYVAITLFSGVTRALHLDSNRGRLAINTAGNTYGHNAAASAFTVASTDARVTGGGPFVGGGSNPVSTDSSDGPRRMFYNPNGSAITPGNVLFGTGGGLTLQKPDITAAHCVTTGFPAGNPFNPFCGTSAAAPHAAAIAAMALSMAAGPTPAQVRSAMIGTALDIEAPGVDRDSGVGIVMADRIINALQPAPPVGGTSQFHTLSPCRIVDTRDGALGARGAPALFPGSQRGFSLAGTCGVPTTAKAVSVNVTITGPTAPGNLRLFPVGVALPLVSAINFGPGQTRANNAVLQVGSGGTARIAVQNDAAGAVNFILDVNGYFQ